MPLDERDRWRQLSSSFHANLPPALPPSPQGLDADSLPQLMTSLCSTGAEQKVYARKVRPRRGWGKEAERKVSWI